MQTPSTDATVSSDASVPSVILQVPEAADAAIFSEAMFMCTAWERVPNRGAYARGYFRMAAQEAVKVAAPHIIAAELERLVSIAFPDEDVDWAYALEELLDSIQRRISELRGEPVE